LGPHARLSFTASDEGHGWGLHLGPSALDSHFLEGSELEEEESVRVLLTDFSDWWIYPPGQTRPCFFSHESCGVDAPIDLDPGPLFLKRIAHCLEIELPTRSNKRFAKTKKLMVRKPVRIAEEILTAEADGQRLLVLEPKRLSIVE